MSQVTVRENPYASHLFPETVQRLFRAHSLGDVVEVVPVKKGFTNRVQRINDRYILKVCGSAANEQNLAREVFLYRLFRGALPVPEPLVADATRHMIPASYMIYEALPGETLYACWSRLEVSERQDIIRQFCAMLRIIAETSYEPFARQFSIALPLRWHDQRLDALQQCLASVAGHGLLDAPTLRQVQAFVQQHHAALWPQHVGLTYWDVHFDNILVMGSRVVGLLDMERTDVMSLDYVLHTVRRLSRYPRPLRRRG